jgi:PHP family Zn ribbon phosphoesterase
MEYIADLHLHSKFSRATSREMVLDTLAYWAKIKGIHKGNTTSGHRRLHPSRMALSSQAETGAARKRLLPFEKYRSLE